MGLFSGTRPADLGLRDGKLREGDWRPNRIVVLEFPDAETAKRFYASPEYGAARAERAGAAKMNMVLVEGLSA
jgi:uncharacterized protein (DUF1330 family)